MQKRNVRCGSDEPYLTSDCAVLHTLECVARAADMSAAGFSKGGPMLELKGSLQTKGGKVTFFFKWSGTPEITGCVASSPVRNLSARP